MTRRVALAALSLGLVLVAAGAEPPPAAAGDPCFHRFDNRPAPTQAFTDSVVMDDCVFAPTIAHVPAGTTVQWTNSSASGHEVVGANLAWGAHEKVLATGDAIGWTFEQPGVYPYSCMLHPGMTGAIIVGDATVAGTPSASESSAAPPSVAERPSAVAASVAAGAAAIALAAAWLVLRRRAQSPV